MKASSAKTFFFLPPLVRQNKKMSTKMTCKGTLNRLESPLKECVFAGIFLNIYIQKYMLYVHIYKHVCSCIYVYLYIYMRICTQYVYIFYVYIYFYICVQLYVHQITQASRDTYGHLPSTVVIICYSFCRFLFNMEQRGGKTACLQKMFFSPSCVFPNGVFYK